MRVKGFREGVAGLGAGEDEDLGAGQGAVDLAGGFEAVHVRHGVVHDDKVGPQLGGADDRFPPVGRRGADFPAGLFGVNEGGEAGVDSGVIVGDQHAGGRAGRRGAVAVHSQGRIRHRPF